MSGTVLGSGDTKVEEKPNIPTLVASKLSHLATA